MSLKEIDTSLLRKQLLHWWKYCGREYPWRHTRDPYHILVAEVLLHRTRADQIVPLYNRFLRQFPGIEILANSTEAELQQLLYTAGLQWRWPLLLAMAIDITNRFKGNIPEGEEELLSLPGVGHYITSAVRCFAFGHTVALLDTNTVRIAGRLTGIFVNDSSRRTNRFRRLMGRLVDPDHPRDFNFAMIDLGTIVCRARDPRCDDCPVSFCCKYPIESGLSSQ